MLEVKLTDEIILDLMCRADNSEHTEKPLILGSGSERTALIYNDSLIVKMPNWWRVREDDNAEWIENHQKYYPKSTLHIWNNEKFFVYSETQTAVELEMAKIIPMDIIKKYGAEIIMWGEWNGHIITFCERLIPVEEDDSDDENVLNDAKELLYEMEKEMQGYSIEVCDLHAQNFGYTKGGKIKFCDLGYWQKSSCGFYVDWDSIAYWENNRSYYNSYNSDNSNDYEDSSS